MSRLLPPGFRAGHWTDAAGWTGCTVVLPPDGSVAGGEVRGGGPGTRESDLLSPAAAVEGVHAVLFTGGSAFGLAAADGVVGLLAERNVGLPTRAGRIPLVMGAVVYDLALGDPAARPASDAGYAAAAAAGEDAERGSVGVGTGCTVGKLRGPGSWTKGGVGLAATSLTGGATVAALAAVNAFGDVVDERGAVLGGVWGDGAYLRTVELLRTGASPPPSWREATTLVCVMTDGRLTKVEAWTAARAASGGVAQAVRPAATSVDGDVAVCLASGARPVDPLAVAALAADVTAAAVRDAVRQATAAPGCPSARDRH
jgi:L-aminopeptidase/D-esterase-like protein